MNWQSLFKGAIARRYERESRLLQPEQIGRLFAGDADGACGIFVDAFGPLVVLTIYNPEFSSESSLILKGLQETLGPNRFVLGKVRRSEGGFEYLDPLGVLGKNWIAWEDDCRFEVRADDKNDFGLFPDARPARLALRTLVKPNSVVLNLFAYTCGFAVVAKKAGAFAAVNVDANPEMLTWGKRNAELNETDFAVVPELAQKYLTRLQRRVAEGKIQCPDVWVCDPPAFGVGRGTQRVLKHFWDEFWSIVIELKPRAILVLRNDRTGFREGATLSEEISPRLGSLYQFRAVDFAQSPSLCYETPDTFYKINESLILFRS